METSIQDQPAMIKLFASTWRGLSFAACSQLKFEKEVKRDI